MPEKQLRKSVKPSAAKAGSAAALASDRARVLLSRARALIARRRFAEARRLLLRVARVKGPYQAQARVLLARLAKGGMKPPRRMNGAGAKKAVKRARPNLVKKSRAPHLAKKVWGHKKKGGGGGGGRGWGGGAFLSPERPVAHTAEFFETSVEATRATVRATTSQAERPAARRAPTRATSKVAKGPEMPGVIRRTPHIDLPPGTPGPGGSFTVEVYLDTQKPRAGETSQDLEIEEKLDQKTYLVDVWMAGSSHFIVAEPKAGVITLDVREKKSRPVPFTVRVADKIDDPAGAVLFAYFTYQGRPSGQVSRAVELTPSEPAVGPAGAPARRPPAAGFLITPGVPSADLTIEITDPERTCQHLVCKVSSRLLTLEEQPQPENWYLTKQSGALVREYMKEFVDDKNHRAYSLIGAGRQLYKAAPDSFKKVLWGLIDRGTPPTSILITSDEPNIPWELMVPYRRGKDGTREARAALGVEFKVGRWTRDDHQSPPPTVPLKDCYVIAPTYETDPAPLAKSAEEVALVLAAVPGRKVEPGNLSSIKECLSAGGRSLLHFVCHGAGGDESDVQAIFLEGGEERLTSLEVTAIPPFAQAFKVRPMVFLNACEVGRPTVALAGIGGFAAAFLDLGAAAVIAPLWSVKDTIAYEVARKFYEAAVTPPPGAARKGFADTMREIRALAYDEATGEDTYAAYCFYGDPNASAA